MKRDLHVHTTYSDGRNTPREMIEAAIEKGMTCIGFSDHAYTSFKTDYCMDPDTMTAYRTEIRALAEEYADRIEVLLGVEQDYLSETSPFWFDYVIGSVHFVPRNGVYIPVDETSEIQKNGIASQFGGDVYAFCEAYYDMVGDVVTKTHASIIGHFDLVTKFNEKQHLIDENDPRYVAAWQKAVDRLLPYDVPFEINTGAISRGYRTTPYPAKPIRDYIASHGGSFILSSDSHRTDSLCFGFDRF